MPTRVSSIISNFAAGELSPKLAGRSDLQVYQSGLERCDNFLIHTSGPLEYRPGMPFAGMTYKNQVATFAWFHYNDEQWYAIEITDDRFHFYANGARVVDTALNIEGISRADPGVVTITGHGLANGDYIYIDGVVGMEDDDGFSGVNGRWFYITKLTDNTFSLQDGYGDGTGDFDTSGLTAWSSGGTATPTVYVASPYTATQFYKLRFTQNADTMFITEKGTKTKQLVRTSATEFTISDATLTEDNTSPGTPTAIFSSSNNYMGCCGFYEGRFVLAATNNNTELVALSRAPDEDGVPRYGDFTVGTDPDHAVILSLAPVNGKVDAVRWLCGNNKFLVAGTYGGLSKLQGGTDAAIAPDSILVKPMDSAGVNETAIPIPNSNVIVYAQRGGLVLRSFEYDMLSDDYISVDRNLVSEHIVNSGIKQLAFQSGRPDIVWATCNDGRLVGVTFKPKEDVSGWFRITPAGDEVKTLSVCVEPLDGEYDRLWLVVERTVAGSVKRTVEYMDTPKVYPTRSDFFSGVEDTDTQNFNNATFEVQSQACHLDSAVYYDGTARGSDAGVGLSPTATTGSSVTFTASGSVFSATDVGNEIWKCYDEDGAGGGRAVITAVNSGTEIKCDIYGNWPFDSTDAIPAGSWIITAHEVSGLHHLEGAEVDIVADGRIMPSQTVTGGKVVVGNVIGGESRTEGGRIWVGLRYRGFVKSLPLAVSSTDAVFRTALAKKYHLAFLNTGWCRFGTSLYNLKSFVTTYSDQTIDWPNILQTRVHEASGADSSPATTKNMYIYQDKPVPCTVLYLAVEMEVGNA